MKTKFFLLFALSALLYSCDLVDAQVVWLSTKNPDFSNCDREERTVKEFEGIRNTCPFDVYYEQSDEQYVIVEGDAEYFDRLHTTVSHGILEIKIDPARYRNVRLRVKVGSPDITLLAMAGSGSLQCPKNIVTDDDLSLSLAGSGDLIAEKIKCADISIAVSGSGDLNVASIEADDVNMSLAGSGDLDAVRLKANNVSISLAGSGDIDVINASIQEDLYASVAGSGDISVSGHARNVTAKIAGSGDISGRLSYENISKTRAGSGDIDW